MASFFQKIVRRISSCCAPNKVRDYGTGNRIENHGAVFKDCSIQFFGQNNVLHIASGATVTNLEITILGSRNEIHIDANVQYLDGDIWCSSDDGVIRIGEKTTISDATLTLTEPKMSITIGTDCLISWKVDVRCGDGHPIVDLATNAVINAARPIVIGNHVWLAAHVEILKGVTIGDHSVIGAHSVVTHDVPAHAVAAGLPAKVVRENITWHRESKLTAQP